MINTKKLKLTIVIPVLNEEAYIADCLDSVAAQSDMPDEVVIVDNNSTDSTVKIASRYPFAIIIEEKQQHQSFAQKTGFDHASGDILGRIDADSILPPDWVKNVKAAFVADSKLQAVTGSPEPYDVSFSGLATSIFGFYHKLAGNIAGTQMIWGANAALRRSCWNKISSKVLQRADIWEDYDLALLIGNKKTIKYIDELTVGSSFRSAHKPFIKQVEYQFRMIRTMYIRSTLSRTSLALLCWSTMFLLYPLVAIDVPLSRMLTILKQRRREILESPGLAD